MNDRDKLIAEAQGLFEKLSTSTGGSAMMKYGIVENLTQAGADFSALDKEGKRSSQDMQALYEQRSREAMIRTASYFYDDIKKRDGGDVASMSKTIREALREADAPAKLPYLHVKKPPVGMDVDFSLLDKEGKKSSPDMETEYLNEVRKAHIRVVRKILFEPPFDDAIAGLLQTKDVYTNLRLANATLADVGPAPTGETAAPQVQEHFSKKLKARNEQLGTKLVNALATDSFTIAHELTDFLNKEPGFSLTQFKPEDAETLGGVVARENMRVEREARRARGSGQQGK